MRFLLVLSTILFLVAGSVSANDTSAAIIPQSEDFTDLWWAEGPPYYLDMKTPTPKPILYFQSGTLGLALDTQSLNVLHAGRFPQPFNRQAALEHGQEAINALPAGKLDLQIEQDGKIFRCIGRGPLPKDEFYFPVRFIESGRFYQRVTIEGLEFANEQGHKLDSKGRIEFSLWSDRLTLLLELEAQDIAQTDELVASFNGQRATSQLKDSRQLTLEMIPSPMNRPILEVADGAKAHWEASIGAWMVRLPTQPWKNSRGTYYPEEELDRLDRWGFRLNNDTDSPVVAPIMFIPEQMPAITGFTPLLCDKDGTPTGLPVQISKNWHSRKEKGELPHQGGWFHGLTFVRLPPKSKRELVFTLTYARWGGVPAASHAQLCLVGWGHNQFWEEAAIGSFGESICYEPGRIQRRCMIDDIRPFMTLPDPKAKPFGWASNAGGGDFLMWIDQAGQYQGFRGTRTDFRSQGPCLTDVRYTEETTGGEITAKMAVSIARSDDYLRAFHHFRYDIRKPIKWQRLAFYQMGADFYNETPSRRIAIGNSAGMQEEWDLPKAKDVYDRRGIPLTGSAPWISVHGLDRASLREGQAAASRSLIVRSWKATLGGKPNPVPHLSTYATEWGQGNFKTSIELSLPPEIMELQPGDFVEADVELVMFPADASCYYGPNETFRKQLAQDADSWRLVQREAAGNALKVQSRSGTVLRPYPLIVAVSPNQTAELTVGGGIGFVPITFTGLKHYREYDLFVDGKRLDQSVHGNDFWQADYDSESRKWSMTFNVLFNSNACELRFCPRALNEK